MAHLTDAAVKDAPIPGDEFQPDMQPQGFDPAVRQPNTDLLKVQDVTGPFRTIVACPYCSRQYPTSIDIPLKCRRCFAPMDPELAKDYTGPESDQGQVTTMTLGDFKREQTVLRRTREVQDAANARLEQATGQPIPR